MNDLKCFYADAQVSLFSKVEENLPQYRDGGFDYLLTVNQNTMDIGIKADLTPLNELIMDNSIDSEIENSLLVWKALQGIPASLAT
jgi:hypothetical protein